MYFVSAPFYQISAGTVWSLATMATVGEKKKDKEEKSLLQIHQEDQQQQEERRKRSKAWNMIARQDLKAGKELQAGRELDIGGAWYN